MRIFSLLTVYMLLLLPCTGLAASLFSQGDLYFDTVANHRDIPDGIVTSIAQDQQGFIWLGTQQGAVRFDGYNFVQFKHEADDSNSLAGNYIRTIWSAPDGKLWFGTFSDGISVLNPKNQTFEHFDFSNPSDERNGNSIRAIVGEASHRVWVASNQALSYLNPYSKKVVTIRRITGCDAVYRDQSPRSLLLDASGGLWLGTQNGLCRINLPNDDFRENTLSGRSFPVFDGQQIHTMLRADNQHIYLGTLQSGLASFNVHTEEVKWLTHKEGQLGHPWVVSMVKDNNEQVWVGTLDGGISIVTVENFSIHKQIRHDRSINNSINQNNIGALYKDRTGLIWIGTWGAGLNLFNPQNDSIRTIRHSPYQESIKSARIRAITETDNGEIWIGYSQKGLSKINAKTGQITHIEAEPNISGGLPDGDILSLLHTENGEVWVGSRRKGLYRFDAKQKRFFSYPDAHEAGLKTITAMAQDHKNRLWVGSTRGVWFANLREKTLHSLEEFSNYAPLQGRITYTLAWQEPNNLWVGTDDGLFHINPDSKTVTLIDSEKQTNSALSDNGINSLHTDQNNQLWVATESGLDKLESWDGQFARFVSINKQLQIDPDYTANIMVDQQSRIWHYKGIYDLPNNIAADLSNSNEWDIGTIWLGSQEMTDSGTLIFGGNEGLLLINPDRFSNQRIEPGLVITYVEVDNKALSFDLNEPLQLLPDTKSFSMEFAALDYTSSGDLDYRWRLQGFDEQWQYASADNRRATYTNLPPGRYQLIIQSTNSKGEWLDNDISVTVINPPAWFETLWFYAVLLAVFTFLMWRLFILRTHHLVRQKRKLDQQISQKTQELTQANLDKDRIMSIVAHDINNKISIGLGYLDLMQIAGNKLSPEEGQKYLRQAIQAGQGCASLVEELRDYGKLSNESDNITLKTTNLIKALEKIVESHQPKALTKKIQLTLEYEREVLFCDLHQAKFSRVIENLLSNAIKFSYEGQVVSVKVVTRDKQALIAVRDEGVGIPEEIHSQLFSAFTNVGRKGTQNEKSTGLGLYIVKKLVQQHRGKVWFESVEGKGSCFYVLLPLTD
ncbi:ligand-binding sensor domain-containing protein [Planctobacterium marinum]|uniref:histidine kinase n=1 Tax=Planctobacterium marinum TaxID=1631968 RepID=A0AA48HV25_9ALTE|nr:hybrid sensor histidine kinase/response regulator [Planctobacterium marinum]